ncbi:hypothetical protein OF83DRAFT_20841 [Amylostereum chailletii]|nr:hypothetical protein OF83DRAFT_20841 [Amylostereum chailletii]
MAGGEEEVAIFCSGTSRFVAELSENDVTTLGSSAVVSFLPLSTRLAHLSISTLFAMSALSIAKQALGREKPRSSVTEWVDILTSASYDDEVYDGIPELIDSIDLQASGPAEVSRAIRKKIKHGNTHQQYRALVILHALVENSGHKFQTSFADGQLTDAIRHLATDSLTDPKVKRKVIAVLASWHRQFAQDPSMHQVAGLYRQVKPAEPPRRPQVDRHAIEEREAEAERKRKEEKAAKEEAKLKARQDKEKSKLEEQAKRKRAKESPKVGPRKAFNFEQERPQVLNAIAEASSAASNLINAITLVNTEHDSLLTNERVQECLTKAKLARKPIVRYIQLVENEELIGTLIETHERISAAVETYDKLSNPDVTEQDVDDVSKGLAAAQIDDSDVQRLQDKQRAAVKRAAGRRQPLIDGGDDGGGGATVPSHLHPDLQDLSFGTLGSEQRYDKASSKHISDADPTLCSDLPPPIRPTSFGSSDEEHRHGSLSDYSDYESSDEETHQRAGPSTSAQKPYVHTAAPEAKSGVPVEDPFADPFAD